MRIFDFAVVREWDGRLKRLAELAEPERWANLSVPSKSALPVLDSYVRYTFLRAHDQGRVVEAEAQACFNTGLLTPNQEEIFGFFTLNERHEEPGQARWWLKDWLRASDPRVTALPSEPRLATYWTDPANLIFDPQKEVRLHVDHIINDNIKRFPTELGGCLDRSGVPTDLVEIPEIDSDETDEESQTCGVVSITMAVRNALEGSMLNSIRLAKRTYRMAVPQFYRGRIQLLLPLYLRESRKADLALTLDLHGDVYRAATVLYPDWAYRHARLLCRPNSEWLGGVDTGDLGREVARVA